MLLLWRVRFKFNKIAPISNSYKSGEKWGVPHILLDFKKEGTKNGQDNNNLKGQRKLAEQGIIATLKMVKTLKYYFLINWLISIYYFYIKGN